MGKVKLYIAQSLNGKIAKKDGSVDWLNAIPNPENTDHGFTGFFNSVGITIQGYKTYKQVIDWGIDFPYTGKINYVFTRNCKRENTKDVSFIAENHLEFTKELIRDSEEDIWLIGGGQLNTWFLNYNLIDELYVFIMPIILSEGIELFELIPNETQLKFIDSENYTNGVVELKYIIEK